MRTRIIRKITINHTRFSLFKSDPHSKTLKVIPTVNTKKILKRNFRHEQWSYQAETKRVKQPIKNRGINLPESSLSNLSGIDRDSVCYFQSIRHGVSNVVNEKAKFTVDVFTFSDVGVGV